MTPTETFQHYQVLRRDDGSLWELGRGAMGVTYKAFDVNLRCLVALKVINGTYLDHPVARQRFVREARAAAALRHRNIAHVYHLGMDAQSFFYAMEFIDGETLDQLVQRQGPLSADAVLRIALQTARALSAASRQRLVHRDIKPTNLMILAEDEDGDTHQTVKVIDFGLARSALRGDASTQLTMNGFVGTPQYASPEQLEEKNVDGRSDIYSLGATLWYLLAGRPPFTGTLTNLITAHLTKEPPWDQLAAVPRPVRELLGRMLQKNPEARPQGAAELRREIEICLRVLAGGVLAVGGAGAGTGFATAEEERLFIAGRAPTTDTGPRKPEVLAPVVGSLVGGRYQVMRLAGEGSTGRVFQAHDLRGEGQTVALKVLHPDLLIDREDHDRLRADAAKVQAVAHPGLLRLLAFEELGGSTYLVEEWSGGLTLVDLLRSRGRLTVGEALGLLKEAAAITDFAREHGLERLELHLHQIFVVPAGVATGFAPAWSSEEAVALLARTPLSVSLRVDPLGPVRDSGELATWGGDLTLVSAQPPVAREHRGGASARSENSYLPCLARLFYELVEGTPPPASHTPGAAAPPALALPGLTLPGNAILRRALSPDPRFASDTEFCEELARSTGFDPEALRSPAAPPETVPPPVHPPGTGASTADAPLSRTQETAGVPPADVVEAMTVAPEVSAPPPRRSLKPLVRRDAASQTLMIDLRMLGWLVCSSALAVLVLVAAVLLLWPPSAREAPADRTAVADDGANHGAGAAAASATPAAAVADKPLDEPGVIEMPLTAPSTAAADAEQSAGSEVADDSAQPTGHEWLEDTVLAQSVATPPTIIPYAPGSEPGDEEAHVPYAPGMSPDERDAAAENASPAAGGPSATEEQTAAARAEKDSQPRRTSGRGSSHRRSRTYTPKPNIFQRIFGIRPKPVRR